MSIRFKTYQCKLKNSKANGKWFGRAMSMGTVNTRTLAEEISHSTTVTRSDVAAVLIELFNAMSRHLLNSQTVVLDEIGSFRVAFKSVPADTEKDFTANNIKSYHIVYRPVTTFVPNGKTNSKGHRQGCYVKTLLNGIEAEPFGKSKKTTTTSGTTTPSTQP